MSANTGKIIQLTTVHPRNDIRIAVKQCATLATAFPDDVELLVADGLGAGEYGNVAITDLGSVGPSRLTRPFKGFFRVVKFLLSNRPRVLHFHDPELIPVGLVAKIMGVRVIYDVHEDVPRQIMGRDTMGVGVRYILAFCAGITEWVAARVLDAIVCATPSIASRFPAKKTTLVQNFPIVAELAAAEQISYVDRPHRFVYVGGITQLRGASEMVAAASANGSNSRIELCLAGSFKPKSLQQEIMQSIGAGNTTYHGLLDRAQVAELLGSARAGLVLFHEAPNHVNAQPNKLFEYMSAGLPVIASDFPLWRELIEGIGSGLLVDPKNPKAISEAMHWILEHPEEAEAMGLRGKETVESRLNWAHEANNLIALYQRLFTPSVSQSAK